MNISKKLYISNIITYISFTLLSLFSFKKELQGFNMYFAS